MPIPTAGGAVDRLVAWLVVVRGVRFTDPPCCFELTVGRPQGGCR